MLTAEIKKLPVKDKLILIEEIWDTLNHEDADIDSPAWHKDILEERKKSIKDGNAKFVSRDDLKRGKK